MLAFLAKQEVLQLAHALKTTFCFKIAERNLEAETELSFAIAPSAAGFRAAGGFPRFSDHIEY